MHISKTVRKISMLALMALVSTPIFAQDRLAKMAPVDKKMRTIDSISLRRLKIREEAATNLDNPSANIYPTWQNTFCNYNTAKTPSEYKIDLTGFHMPCKSRKVTSHFGYRSSFGRNHYGTDIKVYIGDTIRAAFSGKIRVVAYEGKGYGKYVIIRHANGLETLYGHMSKQLVKPNQVVKAGQPIGLGGNTGRSTGSHLHFETRLLGKCINPELMFDFGAADVKGDYYIYRSKGKSYASGKSTRTNASNKKATNNDGAVSGRSSFYSVKSNDETLASIATKMNVNVDELCKLNNLQRNAKLAKGQLIKY